MRSDNRRYAIFHTCPSCRSILSIAETAERFCERCKETIVPGEIREPTGEICLRSK